MAAHAHSPWRDLTRLGDAGWSIAVTGADLDGEPGVQLDAARFRFAGHPLRVRVVAPSVASATPKLLRQINRVSVEDAFDG